MSALEFSAKLANLREIFDLFSMVSSPNGQTIVQQQLDQHALNPEFNLYLVYIFSDIVYDVQTNAEIHQLLYGNGGRYNFEEIRAVAGFTLKNNIRAHYRSFDGSLKVYLVKKILSVLSDPTLLIRSTAASVISSIACQDYSSLDTMLPELSMLLQPLASLASNITQFIHSGKSDTSSIILYSREDYEHLMTSKKTNNNDGNIRVVDGIREALLGRSMDELAKYEIVTYIFKILSEDSPFILLNTELVVHKIVPLCISLASVPFMSFFCPKVMLNLLHFFANLLNESASEAGAVFETAEIKQSFLITILGLCSQFSIYIDTPRSIAQEDLPAFVAMRDELLFKLSQILSYLQDHLVVVNRNYKNPQHPLAHTIDFVLLIGSSVQSNSLVPTMGDGEKHARDWISDSTSCAALEFIFGLAEYYSDVVGVFLFEGGKVDLLLSVLLENMIYSEIELAHLGAHTQEENYLIEDCDHDISPRFHRQRSIPNEDQEELCETNQDSHDGHDDGDNNINALSNSMSNSGGGGGGTDWTLRKCAASTLDALSGHVSDKTQFGNAILPLLQQYLGHSDWRKKEVGILALGAISSTQIFTNDQLAYIIPFLLNQCLLENRFLIRSITCWTLSKYTPVVLTQMNNHELVKELYGKLVSLLPDNNKTVQEASCSAVAIVLEEAASELIPIIPIVSYTADHLINAINKYQKKNTLALFDAIGVFFSQLIGHENSNNYTKEELSQLILIVDPIIHLLCQKYVSQITSLSENMLIPLMECLSCICTSLGNQLSSHYRHSIFQASLTILSMKDNFIPSHKHQVEYNKDVFVVALDLLSAICEPIDAYVHYQDALESNKKSLTQIIPHAEAILNAVNGSISDPYPDLRQASLVVLGDFIKCVASVVEYQHQLNLSESQRVDLSAFIDNKILPHLSRLTSVIYQNAINSSQYSCANNAIWSSGELFYLLHRLNKVNINDSRSNRITALPEEFCTQMSKHINNLLGQAVATSYTQKTLVENCSITLLRLALLSPSMQSAAFTQESLIKIVTFLKNLTQGSEKISATLGLIAVYNQSLPGSLSHLDILFTLLLSLDLISIDSRLATSIIIQDLYRESKLFFKSAKTTLGDAQWHRFISIFPQHLIQRLSSLF